MKKLNFIEAETVGFEGRGFNKAINLDLVREIVLDGGARLEYIDGKSTPLTSEGAKNLRKQLGLDKENKS